MFEPHELTEGEKRIVWALATGREIVAFRHKWWIKGDRNKLSDRAVAGCIGKGLAAISGDTVSATPMTQEMRRRLDRWGRR